MCIFCFRLHPPRNTWVASTFKLCRRVLLYKWACKYLLDRLPLFFSFFFFCSFFSIYLDVLLHHIIILFQFWEEPYITLHSRCTIFLPSNRAKSLQFLHIIANTCSFLFHVSHLMIVKYYLFIVFISLMVSDLSIFLYVCWQFVDHL